MSNFKTIPQDKTIRFHRSSCHMHWRRDIEGTVVTEEWIKAQGYEYTIIGNRGFYIIKAEQHA